MRNTLPAIGLCGMILAASLTATEAIAADNDDGRRVLKMRDVDTVDRNEAYMAAARQKRLESIKFLKELIANGEHEGPRKAEMLLRLSDLYFEQGRDEYLAEMKTFDVIFDKCFNTEGCDTESLQADNSTSQKWQKKSIKLYKQILTNYPRYQRADEATFFLASALSDTGERKAGTKYYKNLVKMYPDSSFVPDAYINLGEYYFDTGNVFKALQNYKKATAYRDHPKFGFALYKLGWSYYNAGEYGDAIRSLKGVVAYATAQGPAAGGRLQLQDEALRDLVRFFADAGELDDAYNYFSKLGKKNLIKSMLIRLAKTYFEQGKWEESVSTYRRLISENPTASENPSYQDEIIKAYTKMGRHNEIFAEIDRMMKEYGADSAWARANASNQEAINEAMTAMEKNLRRVALYHHNLAKKLKNGQDAKNSYAFAYKAYSVYLKEFPTDKHAYEITYSFAELLYTLKKYEEAFEQYMAVVKIDNKGKHSKFCAKSAIYSAEKMVKKESGAIEKAKASETKEAQPLTSWEQRMVDACHQYATLFPEDKDVRQVIYKSGYLLYNKYRFEEAAAQFNLVIQADPRSREAVMAANLILDSFVLTEDWANLKKNAQFYHQQENLGSSKDRTGFYEIYQKASLKIIEVDFAKTKDYAAAADAFLTFVEEFPESGENARILNNATIYYHKVDRRGDAMSVRKLLVNDPRFGTKTKYYYDQIGGLAFDYEAIANFSDAAVYYEKMFALFPKHAEAFKKSHPDDADGLKKINLTASDAVYSAAVFRKALGETEAAVANYKAFIKAFPNDSRVTDTRLTIGKTYEENARWADAASLFYAFYTKAGKDVGPEFTYFARLHYGRALEKQNQPTKAHRLYEETVKVYNKYTKAGGEPGPHTEFVAEMMYKLAEAKFDLYMATEIGGVRPGSSRKQEDKQVLAALKKKAELLLQTERLYVDIIKSGAGEWGLAALVKLGQVYENMGTSLINSHKPSYLNEYQNEVYTMTLEDKAYPQEEKAVMAYSSALNKSYELTLYNENTAFATRQLGVLRPNDYPGLHEELPEVHVTASQTRTFPFETER